MIKIVDTGHEADDFEVGDRVRNEYRNRDQVVVQIRAKSVLTASPDGTRRVEYPQHLSPKDTTETNG